MPFQIGDVVKLKSGGPRMTITGTSVGPDRPTLFNCNWFDKDDHEQSGSYPAAALNDARPTAEPPRMSHDTPPPARGSGTDWMSS
jgi:uncharacterized protein YodC (DUF2158 family)